MQMSELITGGFTSLTEGITQMLKIPMVAGMLGVSVAVFVGKKAIRIIKAR